MLKATIATAAVILIAASALVCATSRLARPKLDGRLEGDPTQTIEIAPLDRALTLARLAGEEPRVVLVTGAGPDGVDAVDLAAFFGRPFKDAVEAFVALGHDALARAAEEAEPIRIDYADLGLPFDAAYPQIAAGTNYRAHAEEVGREDGPFLFPKLSHPTSWNADVPDRARLDHEVEICAVTLSPHTRETPARLGFAICNDFTDRWTLVREMDPAQPMGLSGFPDGKGGEGMLPIGPLLVVPRDAQHFHDALALELWVNGALRQGAAGGKMVWAPEEVLSRAFDDCDVDYTTAEGAIDLTDCDRIPARTLVLTGTPAGVMFHPITLWSKQAYLVPGDEVVAAITHLGVLHNRVR